MASFIPDEPPRWLQAAEKVDTKAMGQALGESAAAGTIALQRDPNAPTDAPWLKSRKGLFQGSSEARLNTLDPMWRLKKAEVDAKIASEIVSKEVQYGTYLEAKKEAEATHQDITKYGSYFTATPEGRAKWQGDRPSFASKAMIDAAMKLEQNDEAYRAKLANTRTQQKEQETVTEWNAWLSRATPEARKAAQDAGGSLSKNQDGTWGVNWNAVTAANDKMPPNEAFKGGSEKIAVANIMAEGGKERARILAQGAVDRVAVAGEYGLEKARIAAAAGLEREKARGQWHEDIQSDRDNGALVLAGYKAQLQFAPAALKAEKDVAIKEFESTSRNLTAAITAGNDQLVKSLRDKLKTQERALRDIASEADKMSIPETPSLPPTSSQVRQIQSNRGESTSRPWENGASPDSARTSEEWSEGEKDGGTLSSGKKYIITPRKD